MPELCVTFALIQERGRRESRVRAAPAVSCAICAKESAHEHTGPAEAIRLSLRDGFTVSFVLSPVTGLLPPSSLRSLLLAKLSASTGAPGPHDFAVRARLRSSLASYPRPPHPTARS